MKCPTCKRDVEWENNPFRPFCSERCKLVDLGKWMTEEYRVPGKEVTREPFDREERQRDVDD
ncbi:MAG TPA: DNA gyrase inhibitor YacG [Pyrinomonadaceae bacterium]|nr:DNA gyrase inhibitor YacG [Pyrinomonadaceae bacterium]